MAIDTVNPEFAFPSDPAFPSGNIFTNRGISTRLFIAMHMQAALLAADPKIEWLEAKGRLAEEAMDCADALIAAANAPARAEEVTDGE